MNQADTKTRIKQCRCKIHGRQFEIFRSFSPLCLDFMKLLNQGTCNFFSAINNIFYRLQCVILAWNV